MPGSVRYAFIAKELKYLYDGDNPKLAYVLSEFLRFKFDA